jgi:ribonuclease HI
MGRAKLGTQHNSLYGEKPLLIHTDSMYTVKCATVWWRQWQRNGWRTAGGKKPVQNLGLIRELLRLASETRAMFVHVRGHGAEPANKMTRAWALWYGNHQADAMATAAASGAGLRSGSGIL